MKALLIVVPALLFFLFIDFIGDISSSDEISLKINQNENLITQKLNIDLSSGGKNFIFDGQANKIYKLSIATMANAPDITIINNENFKNAAIIKIIKNESCSTDGKHNLYSVFFHLKQHDNVELMIEPPIENSTISAASSKDGSNHFELSVFETDESELNKVSEKIKPALCIPVLS